ncbi:MAG: hypothetical protein E7173_02350 [Firmicutes bacterium]|nr:hypothetical protein [Bacillota bacterium]
MPSWTNEQLEAINRSGSNIIVSAGAGSGKTAVLTERVITKIKSGISIDRLLVLTFTKAAANEMKERIRKAIIKEGLAEQLKLLDCAYITTFDSFALTLVKKYHYLINVPPGINIGNENVLLIEKKKILDEIFERLYGEENPKFIRLINEQCVKDDSEIRKYILNIRNKLDMKVDSSEYLETYISKYYCDSNINMFVDEYLSLISSKIGEIKEALNDLLYYVDSDTYTKFEAALLPLFSSSSYDGFVLNSNIKLPRLPQGSDDELKIKKEALNDLIKVFKGYLKYSDISEMKSSIYQTREYAEIIIEILLELGAKIESFKFQNNMYEFNDIAILAIKILSINKDICLEVKETFNEILVDEYQDTSDIQETFIKLIENNNVYMVGDVKQSIYRFRNANPYIFKNKYDNYSNNQGGIKIDLNRNFRSREEVINNINLIFEYIMDDIVGGAEYSKEHKMIFGNKSYMSSESNNMEIIRYDANNFEFDKNEIEAFIIAEDIRNKINNKYQIFDKKDIKLRDCCYSDFAVLMDRTTDFELYKKVFEYYGIPLVLYKDEVINNAMDNLVISNLLSLIKQIKNKNFDKKFRYLFASVARSFICEMSDQKIYDVLNDNLLYEEELFIRCSHIAENLESITPNMLLDVVIDEFNLYETLIKIGDIKQTIIHIEQLYNLSNELSALGYDCDQFIDYLNIIDEENYQMKYSSALENVDAVKIMTIHKSKGLEYPICYFSGLYKSFNISDLKEKIIFDNYFGIILPYFEEGVSETILKDLLKDRFLSEEVSEKIRLLYVALTRAREKIILILPEKENNFIVEKIIPKEKRLKYRSFADMIYSLGNLVENYSNDIDFNDLRLTKDYQLIINRDFSDLVDNDSSQIVVNELNVELEYACETSFSKKTHELMTKEEISNINLGLDLHMILENLDFYNPDFESIENEYYRNKIKSFYSKLKNIENSKIFQEYEFMYEEANTLYHGIIDLMIEYEDHIDIIDYKLRKIDDDAYINQLKGYKKYISTITNKRINIYLYSIFDEEFAEI